MRDKIAKLREVVDATKQAFEEFENIPSIRTVEYEVSMVQFNIRFPQRDPITVSELSIPSQSPMVSLQQFLRTEKPESSLISGMGRKQLTQVLPSSRICWPCQY